MQQDISAPKGLLISQIQNQSWLHQSATVGRRVTMMVTRGDPNVEIVLVYTGESIFILELHNILHHKMVHI